MPRFYKRSRKAGLPPGTLPQAEREELQEVRISLFSYTAENWQVIETTKMEEALSSRNEAAVCWINLDGIPETAILEEIGKRFGIHALVLEDIPKWSLMTISST